MLGRRLPKDERIISTAVFFGGDFAPTPVKSKYSLGLSMSIDYNNKDGILTKITMHPDPSRAIELDLMERWLQAGCGVMLRQQGADIIISGCMRKSSVWAHATSACVDRSTPLCDHQGPPAGVTARGNGS